MGLYRNPAGANPVVPESARHMAPGCSEPTSYCSTGEATPNTTHVLQGFCAGAKNATHAVLIKVVRGKAAPPCRCANDVNAQYPVSMHEPTERDPNERCGRPHYGGTYCGHGAPGYRTEVSTRSLSCHS